MKTRAAVLYATNRPLSIEEVDLGEPGPGCVLVEIAAAGLCHSDLSVSNGTRPRPLPMVLGHEAAGIVRETGSGVQDFAPGDHVVFSYVPACGRCSYCAAARPALCENGARANTEGRLLNGKRYFRNGVGELHHHLGVSAFSQFTVAAQESLVKIDPALPLEIAALFGCAVLTGVGAAIHSARVEPGSNVAVFGLGGVGLSAVLGARVACASAIIAVDTVPEKLDMARKLGATEAIQAGSGDVAKSIRELSAGGVDYAFECTGVETVLVQAYEATRRGGTTIALGLPAPHKQFTVPAVSLVAEERTVKGSYMGSAVPRRDIPRLIALHRAGRLPVELLLTHRVRLEDLNSAFDRLDRGEAVRQVLRF